MTNASETVVFYRDFALRSVSIYEMESASSSWLGVIMNYANGKNAWGEDEPSLRTSLRARAQYIQHFVMHNPSPTTWPHS